MSDTTTTQQAAFACPIDGCEERFAAEKPDALKAFQVAMRIGGREAAHKAATKAHADAAWKTEQKVKHHLRKHDPLEWVRQLIDARMEVVSLRQALQRHVDVEHLEPTAGQPSSGLAAMIASVKSGDVEAEPAGDAEGETTEEQNARVAAEHEADEDPCPKHKPVQHRDGKEPWCRACGKTAGGQEPRSPFTVPAGEGRFA